MIAQNNPITLWDIINQYREKIMSTSSSLGINGHLNLEYLDNLENGTIVNMNPLAIRDDINYTIDKLNAMIGEINRIQIINIDDLVNVCIKIYKLIIRFGHIYYTRYYNDNGNMDTKRRETYPVIFNENFLKNTYPHIYNSIEAMTNFINKDSYKNTPITPAKINELINLTIQTAISRQKIVHNIEATDCHSQCHSSCHSACHDRCNSDCYK